jgi:phytoene dehydrogenase-like protein
MQDKKKVIIIGAGLAGLSAGCYLQANGFDTEIFEMHAAPGGLCTSWRRGQYLIDGCIHFMAGTSPTESTYRFWNDLIDMQSVRFIYSDTHSVADLGNGQRICFYSNVDKLEAELIARAPEDKRQIRKFTSTIRKFINIKMPVEKPYETMTWTDKLNVALKMMPYLPRILSYMKITNTQFASRFKNPLLKRAFTMAFVGDSPLFYSVMPMVWRHKKETGYPAGGASLITGLIEKKYVDSGGMIHFNAKVKRILTENNKATGIELLNGEMHTADIVISAADGRSTIYDMMGGAYKDKNILERYEGNIFKTIDKTLYVSLGINKDMSDQPQKLYFTIGKPITTDPMTTLDHLEFTHYCEDPAAAPKGKTLLTLMPDALDWEYWQALRKNDKTTYDSEKQRIANEIIEALDERFGGIKENVEMIDVVTPATYIRYTNNWTGGQISWKGSRETFGKPTTWQIKGLKDFYMTGQWAGISGGLNNVIMMGNHLTQIICKNEKRRFVSPAQSKY